MSQVAAPPGRGGERERGRERELNSARPECDTDTAAETEAERESEGLVQRESKYREKDLKSEILTDKMLDVSLPYCSVLPAAFGTSALRKL
jgi:hypothetical protein